QTSNESFRHLKSSHVPFLSWKASIQVIVYPYILTPLCMIHKFYPRAVLPTLGSCIRSVIIMLISLLGNISYLDNPNVKLESLAFKTYRHNFMFFNRNTDLSVFLFRCQCF